MKYALRIYMQAKPKKLCLSYWPQSALPFDLRIWLFVTLPPSFQLIKEIRSVMSHKDERMKGPALLILFHIVFPQVVNNLKS